MALFRLSDYLDTGTGGYHDATSWKVTSDAAGNNIIDQSLHDTENLYEWASPLPDGSGGFHADLSGLRLWVKIHILNSESVWTLLDTANQNDQSIRITRSGITIDTVNTITEGIN